MPRGLIAERGTLTARRGGARFQLSTLPKTCKMRAQKNLADNWCQKNKSSQERFEVISRDAEICVQLFSCRAAGILEGSPSPPAAGAGVRPESGRLPKRAKAAHAKTGNKPLQSEEETCGSAIRSCCFSYKAA